MTEPFDDEVADLLALDALERDEQADAELRTGTFPPGLTDTVALLAEVTVAAPPPDLRAATLAAALGTRRPGRPDGPVGSVTPAEAFRRTVADVAGVLASLTPQEWDTPAHPEHGRVRDVVAHLIGVERLMPRWLDPADGAPDELDHVAATRSAVAEFARAEPQVVAARWQEAALAGAAAAGDGTGPARFHDITTSADGLLVMRTFELWAHLMDIARATGRPLLDLDDARMALLSTRLMRAVPGALAYGGAALSGRVARFVLTGPAGGVHVVPLDPRTAVDGAPPDVTIVTDAVELCRVAARRLAVDDLAVSVEGDHAAGARVLAGIGAFARD